MVPPRWHLLAAAKARGKLLDEYLAGARPGNVRWRHIHEEVAFDLLESKLQGVKSVKSPEEKDIE